MKGISGEDHQRRQSDLCRIRKTWRVDQPGLAATSSGKTDICDAASLREIFDQYEIDAVCHFAAESHVDPLDREAGQFHPDKYRRTFNLLEAARGRGKSFRLFHHIQYRRGLRQLGFRGGLYGGDALPPEQPLLCLQGFSDHLVRAYHETYACDNDFQLFQQLRPLPVSGKIDPACRSQCLEEKSLPVYGTERTSGNWLYVTDHCEAIRQIMERGRRGETYNIGGHAEMENIALWR